MTYTFTPMATANAEIRRRSAILKGASGDKRFQATLSAVCSKAPHFWFNNFAWTYDLHSPQRIIPFVPWDFQREFIDAFFGLNDVRDSHGELWPLILEKSRNLGATWEAVGCCLQDWLFNPGADYGLMTRSGTDLDKKNSHQTLMGKLDFMIKMLPDWMVPRFERNYSAHSLVNLDTLSTITGSMTVLNAFRGQRHKRTIIDEAAAVPDLGAVMASVDDVTRSPCMISSARGLGNLFGKVANGLDGFKVFKPGDKGLGWLKLRLHYSQHHDRKPGTAKGDAWIEREKARRTPELWAQEQEIDYRASAPGRIWPEFNFEAHVFSDDTWVQVLPYLIGAQLLEGWDFGSGASLTACVRAAYLSATDTLYLLDYRQWKSATYVQVANDYRAWPWSVGGYVSRRVGDVAGKARDSAQRSWISNLKSEGVDIEPKGLRHGDRVRDRVRVAIAQGRLFLAPVCGRRHDPSLPTLVACVEQYRREVKGDIAEHVGRPPQPRKDIYSHAADALQYIADIAWPAVNAGMREQD